MKLTMEHRLDLSGEKRQNQAQERRIACPTGEGMAHLLGTLREIRPLLGRTSVAEAAWARLERRGR